MVNKFTPEELDQLAEYKRSHPEIDFAAQDRLFAEAGRRMALIIDRLAVKSLLEDGNALEK